MKSDKRSTSLESITSCVSKWSKKTFGPTFKYREHQEEIIIDIIYSWFHDKDNVVLNAPTGSGKSIIAMSVAGVLADYYNKTGYILISDLSLLEQYERDIEMYCPKWGVIRGQQTYSCLVNGCPFPLGTCKLEGCTSYVDIMNKFQDCAPYCEYLVARDKASKAKVTVCTYTHWLIQQNIIKRMYAEHPVACAFAARDFTICDEAHKLLDIIQGQFSPRMTKEDDTRLEPIFSQCCALQGKFKTDYINVRKDIYREENTEILYTLLGKYEKILGKIAGEAEGLKVHIGKMSKKKKMTKSDRKILNSCELIADMHQKFKEYINIISYTKTEHIIKNFDKSTGKITFNCINESYLMNSCFHKNCGARLYMSATIGDPLTFIRSISAKNARALSIPPIFDYTNSPIFYIDEAKMSYAKKDESFPKIVKMIEDILTLYPDVRGIIQTGSYDFANRLFQMIGEPFKQRLLMYDDSSDKQDKLDVYKYSKNKVLVGPTLVEGISLNDDLCRFQIIMKVPYPSLADHFISAKQKLNPQWYTNAACISILQGVGRGVRSETDWCTTFILDGCFGNLLVTSRSMFSTDFLNRIKYIPSVALKVTK